MKACGPCGTRVSESSGAHGPFLLSVCRVRAAPTTTAGRQVKASAGAGPAHGAPRARDLRVAHPPLNHSPACLPGLTPRGREVRTAPSGRHKAPPLPQQATSVLGLPASQAAGVALETEGKGGGRRGVCSVGPQSSCSGF